MEDQHDVVAPPFGPRTTELQRGASVPDDMSVRSFGTESDIFGDATITSSPGTTPAPDQQTQPKRQQKRQTNLRTVHERSSSQEIDELAPSPTEEETLAGAKSQGLRTRNRVEKTTANPDTQNHRPNPQQSRQRPFGLGPTPQPETNLRLAPPALNEFSRADNTQTWRSDYSEKDDEMQNHIRIEEEGAVSHLARVPNRRGFAVISKAPQLIVSTPRREAREDSSDSSPTPEPREWPRYLTASYYVNAILRFMDMVNNSVVDSLSRLRQLVGRASPTKIYYLLAFLALILAGVGSYISMSGQVDIPTPGSTLSWDLAEKFGQLREYLPTFSIPFMSRGSDFPDLDTSDGRELLAEVRRLQKEVHNLKDASRVNNELIKKLERTLPEYLRMVRKDGKLVIPEDFWHAWRSRAMNDEGILTVGTKGDWSKIAARLVNDPTFASTLDSTEKRLTSEWDNWVKRNSDKGNDKSTGSVVSKEEFLKYVRNELTTHELATHRHEVRGQLHELRSNLEIFIEEAVNEAKKKLVPMKDKEIAALVKQFTTEALTNAKMSDLAKDKIHSNWEVELRNQTNYFNPNAGAIINAAYSSKTYHPMKKLGGEPLSEKDYSKGLRGARPLPPIAALHPWTEEGDCWCAARDLNPRRQHHGAKLVVQLATLVVPQQIVLEHILPGATSDAGARPGNIEIYADFEDEALRDHILAFSKTNIPADPHNDLPANFAHDTSILPASFVKIGQFEYRSEATRDGVYVYQLPHQLEQLGAVTDQVAVRATSNHGAESHTCFYRVRMFGKTLEQLKNKE